MINRVFLLVADSFGIGELPDANEYGDCGSNTLLAISKSSQFVVENFKKLGLFNIDGVSLTDIKNPVGSYARLGELSKGKDTTTGHWEIAGVISETKLPTYPNGFPKDVISKIEEITGRKVVCNLPYSGTKVIDDYGKHHMETGDLIVYTSADSVLQIACHEDIVPIEELYDICEKVRKIMVKPHNVGRIIARPFIGEYPNFKRTSNRHDYSIKPPKKTMLDYIIESNKEVISVGKIVDIFANQGISKSFRTKNNAEGLLKTEELLAEDFNGICFVNLVDFDMLFGHRNDVDGYANAISEMDTHLSKLMNKLKDDDVLIITADHGCDPSTASTDHSREYVPMMIYGKQIKENVDLKTRDSFSDISATILDMFNIKTNLAGTSFKNEVMKK